MKVSDTIQDQKLRFIETFMRVNDRDLISKLHELLLRESGMQSSGSSITDEMMEELDERWMAYKKQTERSYTIDQVKSAARQKFKSSRLK